MSSAILKAEFPTLHSAGLTLPAGVRLKASAGSTPHQGASRTRRLGGWGLSGVGPNAAASSDLASLWYRSHEVIRNNPYAQHAKEVYTNNLIGTGINPRWKLEDKAKKEELQELWADWCNEADADGIANFCGLQEMVGGAEFESGEVLIRFRSRRPSDGLTVPLQVQVLEAEHLAPDLDTIAANGNVVRMGIEYDRIGRRVAYHPERQHPGDMNTSNFLDRQTGRVRVPASEIMHVFRPSRPGQMRGIPHLSAILVLLHEVEQHDDATRVKKKIAAMFSAFVTKPIPELGSEAYKIYEQNLAASNPDDKALVTLEPGMTQYLEEGENITIAAPADSGADTADWLKYQGHQVAIGAGITYEQLTGDLSDVNFSSLRASLTEFRRRIEARVANQIVFQMCRPIVNRFVQVAHLSRAIDLPGYVDNPRQYQRVSWHGQGWPHIQPVEDREADQMDIRNGIRTQGDVIANRTGSEFEDVMIRRKEELDVVDQLEMIFDTDPRNTAQSGKTNTENSGRATGGTNDE